MPDKKTCFKIMPLTTPGTFSKCPKKFIPVICPHCRITISLYQ